jgi:hypothetical protein
MRAATHMFIVFQAKTFSFPLKHSLAVRFVQNLQRMRELSCSCYEFCSGEKSSIVIPIRDFIALRSVFVHREVRRLFFILSEKLERDAKLSIN